MLVEAWLERAAAANPDRPAIETPTEARTYAELLALARAGARELAARGLRPGERLAIALPPGLAFAQALHACMLAGGVAVPVDLRLPEHDRAAIAARCALALEEPLDADPAGADTREGAQVHHDLSAVLAVIHSSGTTSAPKPIELTYGNFLWSALGSAVALGLDPEERWLCTLPVAHVGGLSILLRSAIYATTAVIHERFRTEAVLDSLMTRPITLISVVATTLERLLEAGLKEPPTLRCALTGGGPIPPALIERSAAAGVPVSTTYGLTEACSQVTTLPVPAIPAPGSVEGAPRPTGGPPLFCTRVDIAPDGEILVAGPTVAPAALAPDGWLHTGDLGSLDDQGRLRVTGRKSEMIVSGGENVAPIEVEAVLAGHPGVIEAAVLGRPDPEWGEAVTAVIVHAAGAPPDLEDVRARCGEALARFKVPKIFLLSTEPLPRTPSGKLSRRELARIWADHAVDGVRPGDGHGVSSSVEEPA